MTKVVTYRVLLREGKDGTDYSLERTYRSLVPPTPEGGPYLAQEGGEVFLVDAVSVELGLVYGWRVPPRRSSTGRLRLSPSRS